MKFYDEVSFDEFISKLETAGISYKSDPGSDQVWYSVNDKVEVLKLLHEASVESSYSFIVFTAEHRDKVVSELNSENISYKLVNTKDGGFRFVVPDNDHQKALKVFHNAIGVAN